MKIYTITIVVVLLLCACAADANAVRLNRDTASDPLSGSTGYGERLPVPGEKSLEALIAKEIWKLYKIDIPDSDIHVVERQDTGQATAASYSLTYQKVPYAGLIIGYRSNEKWYKLSMDIMKVYRDMRVQTADSGGAASLPNQHRDGLAFRSVYGYVHDPNIRQIRIEYQGGRISTLLLAEGQSIYMDSNIEPEQREQEKQQNQQNQQFEQLLRITMYSANGKVLYDRDYSPDGQAEI
ncbi:hypothetical protein [Paenibacillus bovis]|uniref:Uncharacterized protein n=1 Tax=Paenibacillus bovis TaxID=1616788 RepID=A0A172ZDQ5_9BACL|nr:hypothetical protein [Paenibacillus bovis]ANF95659.1 hypothetical protein AR543_06375 [Paenibacillus bovis]